VPLAVPLRRDDRPYHIALFGATGFVGKLTAAYLDRHAPPGVRIVLVGRRRDKLAELRATLRRPDIGLRVADIGDPESLAAMAREARVVATTVGPYAQYGDPVVAACVEAATDYVDLTGEPAFVDRTIAAHDARARERGALIVPCCGFDSIPTDLGVLYTVQHLPPDLPVTIDGYFEVKAGISGGTLASALGVLAGGPRPPRLPRTPSARVVRRGRERPHWQPELQRWALPARSIDPVIALRSARARADYGPDFRYAHHACFRSLGRAALLAAGIGTVAVVGRLRPVRDLLQRLRPPGTGPDEATRARSWFKFTFIGRAGDARVVTEVRGGDPGYDETARMFGESALCLALERDGLPHTGGVRTTAEAMGEPLLARLQAAGLEFRVVESRRGPA
jgi:short subunit dehydrogenase-like uncharacterized protein